MTAAFGGEEWERVSKELNSPDVGAGPVVPCQGDVDVPATSNAGNRPQSFIVYTNETSEQNNGTKCVIPSSANPARRGRGFSPQSSKSDPSVRIQAGKNPLKRGTSTGRSFNSEEGSYRKQARHIPPFDRKDAHNNTPPDFYFKLSQSFKKSEPDEKITRPLSEKHPPACSDDFSAFLHNSKSGESGERGFEHRKYKPRDFPRLCASSPNDDNGTSKNAKGKRVKHTHGFKMRRRLMNSKMSRMWRCTQKKLMSQRFSCHNGKKSKQRHKRWRLKFRQYMKSHGHHFAEHIIGENIQSDAMINDLQVCRKGKLEVINVPKCDGISHDKLNPIFSRTNLPHSKSIFHGLKNYAIQVVRKRNAQIFKRLHNKLGALVLLPLVFCLSSNAEFHRFNSKKLARRIINKYRHRLSRKEKKAIKALQLKLKPWNIFLKKKHKIFHKVLTSILSTLLQKKAKAMKTLRKSKKRGARSKFYVVTKRNKKFVRKVYHRKRGEPAGDIIRFHEDNEVITSKAYIVEEPELKLTQPPTRHFQSHQNREQSFQRLRQLPVSSQELADSGFFLNDRDLIQCYSCDSTHEIDEVAQATSSDIWHAPHCQRNNGAHISEHDHTRPQPRQVVSDGRVSDDIRDPPGQQSVYIPPGDVRSESYRLSTFEHFPVACPISRKSLAKCGFYFTGFFDRVKCFACGRTIERWEANDNPSDLRWHKDTCTFPRGGDCGNVPITSLFNRIHGNAPSRSTSHDPGEQVLEERDPVTGVVVRTVRYPSDLPERIRQTGGIFEIGPNNSIRIQSGPGIPSNTNRTPGLQHAAPPPPSSNVQNQHQPMRQWRMANVISADHRRFLVNLYLNRELDRLSSFARWPTGRPNVSPVTLAKTGFFYLGDMDRTQCFSCGGVLRNWTVDDNAEAEHRTHFPNCRMVLGTEPRNVSVPQLPDTPDERQRDFPCRFPSNPHMRSEAARLRTFDRRWPMGRTAATPAEIAQAGFFFLGERDRVKCWYCNGGLQHWEYDDMPWIEHAKWFPNCQFLLSVKGQHFVFRHLSFNPHLARPIIARQDGSPIDPASAPGDLERPPDIPPPVARVRQPSPPPTIIDPQEEMRKKRERVENVIKNSDVVKNVLAMGFSEQIVRMLLQEKVESGTEENQDDIYGTVAGLLDDVMKKEGEIQREEEARNNQAAAGPSTSMQSSMPSAYSSMSTDPNPSSIGIAPGSGKFNVSYFGDDDEELMDHDIDMYGTAPSSSAASMHSVTLAKQLEGNETTASLQEALNKIEEERMCKICFSNPANMVFVPCGHMCCCMECTQAIRQCPVCRVKIDKAIKTYLS